MRKDFCLCFNDGYVPYALVTIKSILDNACGDDELHIHVFSDYISEQNMQILLKFGVHVYIIDGDTIFDGIDYSVWSIYTLYRLFLPRCLDADVKKVLYLDCDVIVNDDLDELFSIDLTDKAIAACVDPQTYNDEVFERLGYSRDKKYICAGVLLMNLDYWRKNNLSQEIIEYMKLNPDKILFLEQDAMNYLCCDSKIVLPAKYGVQVSFFRDEKIVQDHLREMLELIDNPSIIHYAGYQPWVYCKNKALHSKLWWDTFRSLKTFRKVELDYILGIIKYALRYVLTIMHIIPRNNKYHIDQYYNHPKVTKKSICKLITVLQK